VAPSIIGRSDPLALVVPGLELDLRERGFFDDLRVDTLRCHRSNDSTHNCISWIDTLREVVPRSSSGVDEWDEPVHLVGRNQMLDC